ncbi:MAG TPA: glycogen synthase GlgA [Candidatus Binataceae bacterium]
MKIAIVAAEIAPFAKAGGLADVIGALPGALKAAGADPALIVPGYKAILSKLETAPVGQAMTVRVGDRPEPFTVRRGADRTGVPIYLIDHPEYFGRDGIYGEKGADYPDNLRRYIFFGRAAALVSAEIVHPDVVHAHDWHAAVAPIVMRADPALRARFARTLAVFTIHNLAFQGLMERAEFSLLNLDASYFSVDYLEFWGRVNLMKGAVVLSDAASTVSPTYAREVTTDPELGFGLEGVLRAKGNRFVGILNGADYHEWDPATDLMIPATFSARNPLGKRVCTRELRAKLNLPPWDHRPLVGMVTRMTAQKGIDLLKEALEQVMELDLQLVMLASGDPEMEAYFRQAEQRYHDRLRALIEFDNTRAHQIQAGSDAFLMPSRFEPCGLTQMYALHYGSAPVVRATGGLRDTVTEFSPESGSGNGFVFEDCSPEDLVAALRRAAAMFKNGPQWRRLMQNCFAADFSWDRAAREYLGWFERLRAARGSD